MMSSKPIVVALLFLLSSPAAWCCYAVDCRHRPPFSRSGGHHHHHNHHHHHDHHHDHHHGRHHHGHHHHQGGRSYPTPTAPGGGCSECNPTPRVPALPPPSQPPATCSIDALKLGLCLDVLGGLVHVGVGDPVQNTCCPVLAGLLELEAAVCLCTAIRLKVLNLSIYIPLALKVLITCGKNPPPGYVCPVP